MWRPWRPGARPPSACRPFPGNLALVAIKRILARFFCNLGLAVGQLHALACLPREGGRFGIKGAGYPDTLDHEAMSPNLAILDGAAILVNSLVNFDKWQQCFGVLCHILRFRQTKKNPLSSMKIEKSGFCDSMRFMFVVPGAGIEPARPYRREILSQ
jgi:hypothetical protein